MNRWVTAQMTGVTGALGSTSTRAALVGAVCIAVLSLALTLPSQVLRWAQSPPALGSDAQDYDHLALNLARGRGFSYCWSDPEWRAPYKRAEPTASDWQLSFQGPCIPTARRAPGYPAALAAVYWVWGRSFMAGRALGAVALAMAGAIGVFLAVRGGGLAAGVPMTLCFLLDGQLQHCIGGLRAEPMASLAVMAVLAAHAALVRDPRYPTGILAGALLGLLVLVRQQFILLWVIGICLAAFCVVGSRAPRRFLLAYASAALLTLMPWCLRNCYVLDALMPLGTQGGHVLATKFVEDKIGNGAWDPEQAARLWAKRTGRPRGYRYGALAREFRTSLAVERDLAVAGQEAARAWLGRNWRLVPAVAFVTLRAHARGYGWIGLLALAWGVVALALPETRRVATLGFVIIGTTALSVALTVESNGRYSAPVRPVAYLIGSLGLAASTSRLRRAYGQAAPC